MGMLIELALKARANAEKRSTSQSLPVEPLPDPIAEARRRRVLQLLAEHPTCRYAVITDAEADPEAVLLTLAIRDAGTCELRIPKAKYDGVLLLDLIERHSATVH